MIKLVPGQVAFKTHLPGRRAACPISVQKYKIKIKNKIKIYGKIRMTEPLQNQVQEKKSTRYETYETLRLTKKTDVNEQKYRRTTLNMSTGEYLLHFKIL